MKLSVHWLLIFLPVTIVLERVGSVPTPMIFACAALAIVPVAALIVRSTVYRSRFLGHGCCRIGPDLQGALVGDRRSYANCVRRVFVTTP